MVGVQGCAVCVICVAYDVVVYVCVYKCMGVCV